MSGQSSTNTSVLCHGPASPACGQTDVAVPQPIPGTCACHGQWQSWLSPLLPQLTAPEFAPGVTGPPTPCWPPGITAPVDHSSHGSQLPELAQEELTLHRAPADDVLRHLRHREEKVPWLKVTRGSPCLSSSSKPPSPSLSRCLWAPPGWGLNPIPTLNHPGHSLCHCSGEADGETEARGQPGALPSSPGPGLTVAT